LITGSISILTYRPESIANKTDAREDITSSGGQPPSNQEERDFIGSVHQWRAYLSRTDTVRRIILQEKAKDPASFLRTWQGDFLEQRQEDDIKTRQFPQKIWQE
jgi:hypothetical protein